MSELMSKAEKALLQKLGDCMTDFYAIYADEPAASHTTDIPEFQHHIHILQRHVMSRVARREMRGTKL